LKLLLAANPYHAAASLELARVQLARGALRDATRTLQPALTNDYTMRASYMLGAQIAQRNNQADVAAQLSRRAAALPRTFDWPDPVLREVQSLRKDRAYLADQVNGYLQQLKLPETEAALNKLLSTFPDDPEGLLLLGRLRYVQKRCPEAESAYRKHLVQQPESLNGLIQLGLALMCQERWSNAVSILEQAVALKPDFAQAHNNLGTARSKAGDATGAIRAFRDALRCSPGDINAHMSLAEELANENQIEEAKQHVQSAAALNPNDARVLRAREQLGIK
jgi:tetratricopeptide (TPR) repeat protein